MMKKYISLLSIIMLFVVSDFKISAHDSNFHIYLCLGQSNMEGNAPIEPIDRTTISSRFKMMATVDFASPARTKGEWYKAEPPLVRHNTGLTPMDYFGRTMVENLPAEVTVGVIPVAVGGCRIEHLDKDFNPATLESEAEWFKAYMKEYDNVPYSRLIECARLAQSQGVIKGILLHQGESNNGDAEWPDKVRKIYEDILADLSLEASDVPLIAGEVVTTAQGGVCGAMNSIINTLPRVIPTARVVSAANLEQKGDGLHFTSHAYRVLGCRYAAEMLATFGINDPKVDYSEEIPFIPTPEPSEGDFVFDFKYFNPSIWESGTFEPDGCVFTSGLYGFGGWEYDRPIDLSGYRYLVAELDEEESNGVEFKVFDTASYWEIPYAVKFNGGKLIVAELDGMMKSLPTGIVPVNTSEIYRVGFWAYGFKPIRLKHVFATNENPYSSISSVLADANTEIDSDVYDLLGRKVAVSIEDARLSPGVYLSGGKKVLVR